MTLTPENTSIFILAAGRGKRMMPLTTETPKPLLEVAGKSLIEHHLQRIANLGFKKVVINIDYLGEKIIQKLGDGQQWGIQISYSDERESGALETAGGIQKALALIESDCFLCLNADLWTSFDIGRLLKLHEERSAQQNIAASIVLIPNPSHNPDGDFSFDHKNNLVLNKNKHSTKQETYTFSGIACYRKQAFAELKTGKQPLAPLLNEWSEKQLLSGVVFYDEWHDIGTPARLKEINDSLINS